MESAERLAPLSGRAAALPDGLRIYAVGDVHGRLDLLREMEALIDADARSARGLRLMQVMLGDYIDRGPDSAGVIAHLLAAPHGRELVTLRGNHEAYILDTLRWSNTLLRWCRYGGREALASYGVDLSALDDAALEASHDEIARLFVEALPQGHAEFVARTRLSWRCGDYLFVHAGIRPGVPLEAQAERDMLTIRGDFLESSEDFGVLVVHGHTPTRAPVVRANRIGIDTRAYDSGVLTCLVLEGTEQRFLSTA